MDKIQNLGNSECYTPSSEPFGSYKIEYSCEDIISFIYKLWKSTNYNKYKIWSCHGGDYEECFLLGYYASVIRVTRIGDLGTMLAVTSNGSTVTLMMKALRFYETSILTRATQRNIPKDGILQ
jgi:hypothetical protein